MTIRKVGIKVAKVMFIMAASYVVIMLGYIWAYTFMHGVITIGLIQAHLYLAIIVGIYKLTEKRLWGKPVRR